MRITILVPKTWRLYVYEELTLKLSGNEFLPTYPKEQVKARKAVGETGVVGWFGNVTLRYVGSE